MPSTHAQQAVQAVDDYIELRAKWEVLADSGALTEDADEALRDQLDAAITRIIEACAADLGQRSALDVARRAQLWSEATFNAGCLFSSRMRALGMPMLTRHELDPRTEKDADPCPCEDVQLSPRCHPHATVRASYDGQQGRLRLRCAACDRHFANIAVEPGGEAMQRRVN
ncbi:MAG TPA: hypothetical protein VFB89_13130 [Gemmatimonadales bacterium]|nr:hypothetical protein [Gemmatimonadales bacterium]